MSETVRVRIPVAVDPKGRWYAYGSGNGEKLHVIDHDQLLEVVDHDTIGPNEALFWVVAELPIPGIQIIEGEAQPAETT